MNTITIHLCEEDRKRLDVISDTLELIRLALTNAGTPFPAAPVQPQNEPEPVTVAEPAPEPEQETAPWETAPVQESLPAVKLADVQKKVVDLSTAGKKDAVKAVVQAYAPRVSAIPEDKLAEVLAKLTELEG